MLSKRACREGLSWEDFGFWILEPILRNLVILGYPWGFLLAIQVNYEYLWHLSPKHLLKCFSSYREFVSACARGVAVTLDRRSIRFFSVFVIHFASQISFVSFRRWDGLVSEILEPLRVVAEVVWAQSRVRSYQRVVKFFLTFWDSRSFFFSFLFFEFFSSAVGNPFWLGRLWMEIAHLTCSHQLKFFQPRDSPRHSCRDLEACERFPASFDLWVKSPAIAVNVTNVLENHISVARSLYDATLKLKD